MRVLNSSSRAVTLQKGSLAADLESVEVLEVDDRETTDQRSDTTEEWAADLLNRVEADIGAEIERSCDVHLRSIQIASRGLISTSVGRLW